MTGALVISVIIADAALITLEELEHGLRNTYTNRGCRCEACSAANAEYQRKARALRQALTAAGSIPSTVRHGSEITYLNWGCKCELCVQATRRSRQPREIKRRAVARATERELQARAVRNGYEWTGPDLEIAARTDLTVNQKAVLLSRTHMAVRAMMKKLVYKDPANVRHGTISTYNAWGCRCDRCRAAVSRAKRSRDDATRALATRNRFEWTGPELEIAARPDLTAREAALLLRRTHASVQTARQKLRKGDPRTHILAGLSAGDAA